MTPRPTMLCHTGQVHSLSESVKQYLVMFTFFWLLENWGDTGQMYPRDEVCYPSPVLLSALQWLMQ